MEWLNYHHLYYFWTVCSEGGFSKAAARLRISQSAVSHQIALLENYLGEQLMERSPRGFKLTEAGQFTFSQADEIFRFGNDLVQYFRSGQMKSSFRIGALSGLSKNLQIKFIAPILEDQQVELTFETGDSTTLLSRLVNYQIDAVLSDVSFPSSEAEPLMQSEVYSETICLVIAKKNARKGSHFNDYLKSGIYLPSKSSPVSSGILEQLDLEKLSPLIKGYIDDIALLRLLALEAHSIVAIPKIGVMRELASGELKIIHEFKKIRQRYFLVYRKKGKRHPVLNKLLKG